MRAVRRIALSTVIARLAALRDVERQALAHRRGNRRRANVARRLGGCAIRADARFRLERSADGRGARGPGNVQERAQAARCDTRRRLADALDGLAQPLRRVERDVCARDGWRRSNARRAGGPIRQARFEAWTRAIGAGTGQALERGVRGVFMRLIMENRPLERCWVSASLSPRRSNTWRGSAETISCGVRPEKMRSSIAIAAHQMCAGIASEI